MRYSGRTAGPLRPAGRRGPGLSRFAERLEAATRLGFQARKAAEKALAVEVPGHWEEAERLLHDGTVGVRRTLVELLRRHARHSPRALALLAERLRREPDVKTRRRVAAALGASGRPEAMAALAGALEREQHRYARASIVLALGALGFAGWSPVWRRRAGEPGPVGEALDKALSRVGAAGGRSPSRSRPRPAGRYLLQVYPGAEPLAAQEWRHAGLADGLRRAPGWVEIDVATEPELVALAGLRTVVGDFHLAAETAAAEVTAGLLEEAARTISATLPEDRRWSFRLGLPPLGSRSAHRRAVRDLARRLAAATGWRNSPSDYDLDVRAVRLDERSAGRTSAARAAAADPPPRAPAGEHRLAVVWRDCAWPVAHRNQSWQALPASIHPSVAAALCRAAIAGLGDGARRMVDPCCGGGTLLAEWLAVAPAGRALGFDRSLEALRVARHNLAGKALLAVADLGSLPLTGERVDAVIANLPFGLRVRHAGPNRALYGRFVGEALRVVRPAGRLVAYTADREALAAALAEAGVESAGPAALIQAGGLVVAAFVETVP